MTTTKNEHWIDAPELTQYRQAVQDVLAGELDETRFQALRLQQGVYGQRQDGVNMIRVKLPGGVVSPSQLGAVADVLDNYCELDIASVTTRQDIQLHSIPLSDTPAALEKLAEQGLTSREACGNTVRNITACPLAGVCPCEHSDVQPVVDAVAQRFLRHPLTQHLPRKFKMSFSGCEADCAQGLFHDLAVIAVKRDGVFGYKVLAAGGLGHKPRPAITLEEFVEESELLPVIEAVLALHHRYSDRKRRARARMKFLLEKLGETEFVEKYREELQRTKQVYASDALPAANWVTADETVKSKISATGAPRDALQQRQAGLYVYPVSLPLGDLGATQMRGLMAVAEQYDNAEMRVTQDQNLMLMNIPQEGLQAVKDGLRLLELDAPAAGDDVVACPGTWTCRLGITASRLVSAELTGGESDLRIRVSGCHNGCAQPYVGDIGMHGEGRRINGKLIPHYRLHFGGDGRNEGEIAVRGPEVPVRMAPAAVKRVSREYENTRQAEESFRTWAQRQEEGYFAKLLQDLTVISGPDSDWLSKDFGETEDFRVLALGGGECMGAKHDVVSANFSEAAHEREYRRVFQLAKKEDQALDCAEAIARLVAQALLHAGGENVLPDDLTELAGKIAKQTNVEQGIAESLSVFIEEMKVLRADYDDARFEKLANAQDLWTVLVARACESVDIQLDVQASLPEITQLVATGEEKLQVPA
ncbi:MAG: nitrite/sulfite reductase [Gammaproteobacteria bacterium]|nr:nitrite/sulfite reductase [Gammaproteobacteria bacterium]MCF6260048.1 nitrite/sulfite reductase [Gammaproteobacteria bacterium]